MDEEIMNNEIEIYPTIMVTRFIQKKLLDPVKENSIFIIVSSFENMLKELSEMIPQNRCLMLNFISAEISGEEKTFTSQMADEIQKFVRNNEAYKRIYICCDDGQTVSNGIACAFYRYGGDRQMENIIWNSPYACPNIIAYKLVSEALGMTINDDELKKICETRDNALQNVEKNKISIKREFYRYGLNSRVSKEKKLEFFSRLSAPDGGYNVSWSENAEEKCELSIGDGNYGMMQLCQDIAFNSLEFVWYYGLTASDFGM